MSKFMYAFRQTIKQVKRNKGMAFTSVFAIAQSNYACHLQRHADNKGKGRALKTAISFIISVSLQMTSIVTLRYCK